MLITNPGALKAYESCHRVWQGIPGIVHTKGGRTFVSFYSGNITEANGNFALIVQSDEDADFGEPIAAAFKPGDFRCFDPVLWIDPMDRLWFIWSVMPGEEVFAAICEDPDAAELKWGQPFYIGRGIMMNKPTVLRDGQWLFPVAVWKKEIFSHGRKAGLREDELEASFVYSTTDCGKTFTCLGWSQLQDRNCDEHMILEQTDGTLKMFVRTNYGIGVSESHDGGKTWSVGEDSGLGGPVSRFFISRLRSGRIMLINHMNFTGRNNLTALLSDDDGKTFPYSLLLDERDFVSYPDAMEAADGYIYIAYDRERGYPKNSLAEAYACAREILAARITEEDILSGTVTTSGSYLKHIVSKLGKLAPEDPDPYL